MRFYGEDDMYQDDVWESEFDDDIEAMLEKLDAEVQRKKLHDDKGVE